MPPDPIQREPTEADKVVFLSRPEIWPHRPDAVDVVETHMSWVFLAGDRVFKLKKPIRTPFLDFSTRALREASVAEELRLNRRLAPGVYLGATILRVGPSGGLALGGKGRIVDRLVRMRRLPETSTLKTLIEERRGGPGDLAPLCRVLGEFYRGLSPARMELDAYAERFEREHAETKRVLADPALAFDGPDVARSLTGFETAMAAVRPFLGARVRAGRIVEGHGDLRPEHVFLTDPPVVIDCLEFNRDLRLVDPFDEIAFLGLESARIGADWVLPCLTDCIGNALRDRPDPALMAFYWRYRALLRARIALLHLKEPVLRDPGKWRPLARRYLALAEEADLRFRPR